MRKQPTNDGVVEILEWREAQIGVIEGVLGPLSSMAADEDASAAEAIFDRLLRNGDLLLPDIEVEDDE